MLLFADSFDHYNSSQLLRKWDSALFETIEAAAGRNGTAGHRNSGVDGSHLSKAVPSNPATLVIGTGLFATALPTGSRELFQFTESGAIHVNILLRSDGKFDACRNGTVLGTSSGSISAGQYNSIEVKTTIHDSTGVITIKLNNVQILNLTAQDTRNGGSGVITNFGYGEWINSPSGFNSAAFDADDFYMLDTTGGTNNDFLGDVRVQAIFVTGAGNYTQWVPSAGSNFQNVDDNPPNDDTDYNSESTAADKDSFVFGDVTPTTGTVYAVAINMHARKDDGGTRTIRSLARLSAVDAFGANINVGTTYANYQSIHETKPGGGAWTITDVNNSEYGYELVA